MDTTEITHISLCSGYGGIDLGLKRVLPNLRTVAYAEIEAFACENLLARMEGGQLDAAPIWSDLKSFPWEQFSGLVDILSGGYPCQPFSSAGKRAGADDPRHLWPFISAGIAVMRPSLCFFENVEGHISLGLPDVIEDLGRLGYRATWGIFSAAECGAPHQRKRVFIMAHRINQGSQGWLRGWQDSGREGEHGHTGYGSTGVLDRWPARPGKPQHAWEPPRVVADARHQQSSGRDNAADGQQPATGGISRSEPSPCSGESSEPAHEVVGNAESKRAGIGQQLCGENGRQGRALPCESDESNESMGNAADAGQPQRGIGALGQPGTQQEPQRPDCGSNNSERETQPEMGGNINGTASGLDYAELSVSCDNRTDELRLLGNGVVPATAALAFRTLLKELTQ